jgi:putative sigma-54 modulation protein
MRLVVTGRNVDITPALRKLIDRKLARLKRLLGDAALGAQVVLALEKYRHIADVTVHARGDKTMHGLGDSAAWETSLGEAVEKIIQQAQRVKGKWRERKRRATPARALPAVPDFVAPAEEKPSPRVIRAARYAIKPMTVEEAAMAVDGTRDAFLVFRNASTDLINVLYRRKDGDLGLIDPDV